MGHYRPSHRGCETTFVRAHNYENNLGLRPGKNLVFTPSFRVCVKTLK